MHVLVMISSPFFMVGESFRFSHRLAYLSSNVPECD